MGIEHTTRSTLRASGVFSKAATGLGCGYLTGGSAETGEGGGAANFLLAAKLLKNRTTKSSMKSRGMGGWPAELKPKVPLFPLLFSVAPLHHKGSTETSAGVLDQSSVQFRVV